MSDESAVPSPPSDDATARAANDAEPLWLEMREARARMVREQIERRGVRDPDVLRALRAVPRHRFFAARGDEAYQDWAHPIACRQTISQPYIVALMTESLRLTGGERVLEIGAGSGYQSAVLSLLCRSVIAIERHAELADGARRILAELGIPNVEIHVGDGSVGFPAHAPYDAILVAAAAPDVPPALVRQLAPGGRLVAPVGPEQGRQQLVLITKNTNDDGITRRILSDVSFVPLVGAAGYGLPDDLGSVDV